mgnify:CR=1 FL=1
MKKKLLIIGASGHGKVVADIALKMKNWESIAFIDDNSSVKALMGLEVVGNSEDIPKYISDYQFFVAVGNNATRQRIYENIKKHGGHIPVLIHPEATIGKDVHLGSGTVVMAGAIINSGTTIGKGCIINTGATVDHDNELGDFVHISPGVNLAGTVKVGHYTWFGVGSVASNNLSITKNCMIGAGAVVVKDINEPGTYLGVPARRILE